VKNDRIYVSVGWLDFDLFEHDSASAHRACEMVEFLWLARHFASALMLHSA